MSDVFDVVEFSRPVLLSHMEPEPVELDIEANEEECAALATRFELLALKNLKAHLTLQPGKAKESVSLSGSFSADVTQACVVTLQDVQDQIKVDLEIVLLPYDHKIFQGAEEIGDEDYEPIRNDSVDLGEVVAQYLSLSLNPYPRHPSAELMDISSSNQTHPFHVLHRLRKR